MLYLLLILFFILAVMLAAAVFWQYRKIRELDQLLQDDRADPARWTFSDQNLINQASVKVDNILSEAEVAALRMTTEKVMDASLFEENLKQKMDETIGKFNSVLQNSFGSVDSQLRNSITQAQARHDEFLMQLEKQSVGWSNRIEEEMHGKITGLLLDFEQKLTDFFSGAEKKSENAINLEIKSARELIESYKSQQLSVIDENIVAVLERTMSLVLKEKLTLKDQVDMVFESLEKAKQEKFLI